MMSPNAIWAEKALHDAALHWQATFNSTQDAICLFDADQRIIMCNRMMQEILGIKEVDRYCRAALLGGSAWYSGAGPRLSISPDARVTQAGNNGTDSR